MSIQGNGQEMAGFTPESSTPKGEATGQARPYAEAVASPGGKAQARGVNAPKVSVIENDRGSQQGSQETSPAVPTQIATSLGAPGTPQQSTQGADASVGVMLHPQELRLMGSGHGHSTIESLPSAQRQRGSEAALQQQHQRIGQSDTDIASSEQPLPRGTLGAEQAALQSFVNEGGSAAKGSSPSHAAELSVGTKLAHGGDVCGAPLDRTRPGAKPVVGVIQADVAHSERSPLYREKYVEVMRDFQAGQLRGQDNKIVKDHDEARAMACSQAAKFEQSAAPKSE